MMTLTNFAGLMTLGTVCWVVYVLSLVAYDWLRNLRPTVQRTTIVRRRAE